MGDDGLNVLVLNPPFLAKFSRSQRSPAVTKSGTLYFPMWLSFCVGALEREGHDVLFIDAPAQGHELGSVLTKATSLDPRLVVMDTSTPSIANDLEVAAALKEALPGVFIVLVGTHVSALPEETLLAAGGAVDAVARREYELTVTELASRIQDAGGRGLGPESVGEILGLSYRREGRVEHSPDRPLVEDLDSLPWVSPVYKRHLEARHYFNPLALYPMITLVTSRGCPFRCSFCVYPQAFSGRRYRFRSIDDVLREMEYVTREFPEACSIFFEDDTLTANKKRCREFAEAIIAKGLRIPWTANSRIDLDYETMVLMKRAGCRQLCVGFESGDQAILDGMKKATRIERMQEFMGEARRAGILIHGCFMLGFPEDTPETVEKTIRLSLTLNPDTVQFYPVMVYPGTDAYEEYRAKGWITAKGYREWLTPEGLHNCVVRNDHFTSADLVKLCDQARRRFYLRPSYLARKARQLALSPVEIGRTAKAARTFLKHLIVGSRV
ncbi:MAG: radical SAM protein [Deltaproteobacteria bacterium]|nr:radical SAM protein [Deltaproteobacteria bacterium]